MGVVIVEGEGTVFGLNLGRPIVTNGDFVTRLFPNYSGQYLFQLRQLLRSIRQSLTPTAVKTTVHVFVSSRVDYCNKLFWRLLSAVGQAAVTAGCCCSPGEWSQKI